VRPTDRVQAFLNAFAAILRHSNYRFVLDLYAAHQQQMRALCGSLPGLQATGEPRDVPCYRTNLLLDIYRRYFGSRGWLQARLGSNHVLNETIIDEMAEGFYRCTACRRCKIECPMGIDHGLMTHLGRYILSEAGIAPKGLVVSVREQLEGKTPILRRSPYQLCWITWNSWKMSWQRAKTKASSFRWTRKAQTTFSSLP